MPDIIRFHVPCHEEYQTMVGEFAGLLSKQLNRDDKNGFGRDLQQVMTDVFFNIVKYSNTAAQNEVVRFQFELGHQFFLISIYDYGPGFAADQFYPPYPKEFIGQTYQLCKSEDGFVYFKVMDPLTISFFFSKESITAKNAEKANSDWSQRCINLARIAKRVDSITYSYIGQGKYDWKLIKNIG